MDSLQHHDPEQNHEREKNANEKCRKNRKENVRLQNGGRVEWVVEENQENTEPENGLVLEGLHKVVHGPVELEVAAAHQHRNDEQRVSQQKEEHRVSGVGGHCTESNRLEFAV